ncbi:MAG: hypothetical protein M3419_06420 [Actinomycetota bacterium]|nr:hypothetical protein [Actinomycetota bacterium]
MQTAHGAVHRWRWTSETLNWVLLVTTALSGVLALGVWRNYGSAADLLDREQVGALAGFAVLGALPCLVLAFVAVRVVPVVPRLGYVAAGAAWVAAPISPAPLVAISQQHLLGSSVAVAVCAWGVGVSVLAVREGWGVDRPIRQPPGPSTLQHP